MTAQQRFASAADTICVWDPFQLTHPLTRAASDTKTHFTSVRWSENGQLLVAANGGLSVFKASGPDTATSRLKTEKTDALCACFSGTRHVLSGHTDSTIKLWNIKSKSVAKTFKSHTSAVTCLAMSCDGSRLLSGSTGGDLICHNISSGDTSRPMKTPTVESVTDVQFSVFSNSLATSSSQDGYIHIWDMNTQQLRKTFAQQHHGGATSIAFSLLNEKLFASCGMDGKINFYDAAQQRHLMSRNADVPLSAVLIMSDGFTVIAGSATGYFFQYDLRSGISDGLITSVKTHQMKIASLSCRFVTRISGGGHRASVASQGSSGTIEKGRTRHKLPSETKTVVSVSSLTHSTSSHQSTASGSASSHPQELSHSTASLQSNMGTSSQRGQWNEPVTPLVSFSTTPAIKSSTSVFSPESVFSPLTASSTMKLPRTQASTPPHKLVTSVTNDRHKVARSAATMVTESTSPLVSLSSKASSAATEIGSYAGSLPLSSISTTASMQTGHLSVQPPSMFSLISPPLEQQLAVLSTSVAVTCVALQPPSFYSSPTRPSHDVSQFSLPSRQPISSTISGDMFSPLTSVNQEGNQTGMPTLVASSGREFQRLCNVVDGPKEVGLTSSVAQPRLDPQMQSAQSMDEGQSNNTLLATTATARVHAATDSLMDVKRIHPVASLGTGVSPMGNMPVHSLTTAQPQPQFHLQVFQSMIDDSIEELRLNLYRHIRDVHVDIIRQFEQTETNIQAMLETHSVNPALLEEIARLKEENERLKRKY